MDLSRQRTMFNNKVGGGVVVVVVGGGMTDNS